MPTTVRMSVSSAKAIKSENGQIKTTSAETKARTLQTKSKEITGSREKRSSGRQRCHHSNELEASKTADRQRVKNISLRRTETTLASQKHKKATSDQNEQRVHKTRHEYPSQNQKAFLVVAPNPKKRNEILRKAKAELAALEDFKLSRAMGFVSIAPSRVGGCLTLEEVRNNQQQEIQRAKITKR